MTEGVRHFLKGLLVGAGLTVVSLALSLFVLEAGIRILDGVPVLSTTNFVARASMKYTAQASVRSRGGLGSSTQSGNAKLHDGRIRCADVERENCPLAAARYPHGRQFLRRGLRSARRRGVACTGRTCDRHQVVDAAVGGYGLDQLVLRAEIVATALEPAHFDCADRLEYGNSVDRMSVAGGAPSPISRLRTATSCSTTSLCPGSPRATETSAGCAPFLATPILCITS